MLLDFGPLEGITTAPFRKLHAELFPGVDRYYTPFLSPGSDHLFTPRQLWEILPEHNGGLQVIPQILTKNAEDFLWAARELHAMGHTEVNLNVGCPSGTVTAKGKGSGMLADLPALDGFLDKVFSEAPCAVSVKTRLGLNDPEEFDAVLEVYDRYPMSELIIHPRVRKDLYRHPVRTEVFDRVWRERPMAVSYNGSIVTPKDYEACQGRYPGLKAIMIGQGLVSDLALVQKIKTGQGCGKEVILEFHDRLLEAYTVQFGSAGNAFKRMKDVWFYLIRIFADSEKYGKRILKSKSLDEYTLAVYAVFRDLELLNESAGGW